MGKVNNSERKKLNRTQKPCHRGWKDPVGLARSEPAGSGASVGPAVPNHSHRVAGALQSWPWSDTSTSGSENLGRSLLGKEKRRETQKSCTLSEDDGHTVSTWLYVTVTEQRSLSDGNRQRDLRALALAETSTAQSGCASYSQGPSRQDTGSLRRLRRSPHLCRFAWLHWIKLSAAWSDVPFFSKRSSSDKVTSIMNYSLTLYCNSNCHDWEEIVILSHVSHDKI